MTNPGPDRPYWSFSRLSAYSCSMMGKYKYEDRLVPKGEEFFALTAGQDGHEILHLLWAEGLTPKDAVEQVMGERESKGLFSGETKGINSTQMLEIVEDYHRTIMSGPYRPVILTPDMIDFSKLVHPTESELTQELELNGQLSELGVAVQWEGLLQPYGGYIDRLMQHQETGHYEVWDTKFTTSPLTDFLGQRWEKSFQMIGYAAIWRTLTNLDIDAAKVEAIYIGASKTYRLGQRRYYTVFDGWNDGLQENLTAWINDRVTEITWRQTSGIYTQVDGSWPSWRQKICKSCDFNQLCYARPSARPGLIKLHYEERLENE